MRFYIDEDVDLPAVRRALRDLGYTEVWHVSQARLLGDSDANQLAYAIHKDAVLIMHDPDIINAHHDLPIGRVVLLDCLERDAPDTLRQLLPVLAPVLEAQRDLYVTAQRNSRGVATPRLRFGTERRTGR